MRKALADALLTLAESDPRVIFLTGDLGFGTFDTYQAKFPQRYINVGVAEAQLVCAAAGLAMEGWRPIIYSIASFATGRPFEQLRIAVGYPNLPVILVGAGGGFTYAKSGVTHHAAEDLGLMSIIPNMTVTAPGDSNELKQLLPQLSRNKGPSYLRIGKYGEPDYQAEAPVVLGRARLLRDGQNIALLSTGPAAYQAVEAIDALKKEGIHPALYQFHTVQPIDTQLLDTIYDKFHTLIVIEEHVPAGGLSAAVSSWRAARDTGPKIVRVGPPHALLLGNPTTEEMLKRFGLDVAGISATCRKLYQSGASHTAKAVAG